MKIKTRTRYKIVGSDYSAQEPRMTAYLSKEPKMYEAYLTGKDLYAMIAMSAFDNRYEDNLEFYPEGTELEIDGKIVVAGKKTHKNPDGKARRSVGKVLNLAATYGMSGPTAGARLNKTPEEGQQLLDNFFNGFPKVKEAIDYSKEFLKTNGYVEDFYGRRRHLPEIKAQAYEVKYISDDEQLKDTFNPYFGCSNRAAQGDKIVKWQKRVAEKVAESQAYQQQKALKANKPWKENDEMSNMSYEKLAAEARQEGIMLIANTGRRAQAERQCFNARIQGGAATLTKLAMIDISKDTILNDCHTQLIIPVHDELLVECPEYYSDIVEKRLPEVMVGAAKSGGIDIPQSCDPYNVYRWYADELSAALLDSFTKLTKSGMTKEKAIEHVVEEHSELPRQSIIDVIEGRTPDEVIF